ncbi:polyribonucleotide nucleotidyltransferase 2, mitochondrial-like isoform X2 [Punica granatum]|uniref:Polyribonucleotide nucleotidyltransferase 2, mitochondrial-like isoform X2 n=1 Tax=Punica granatum TaxID=22663 RepID=A0A6P8D3B6_PUNGR|nr:polyribonucleotide nucleotidyltransferase 2, mitochondrial-like isoform X2 [Punica granatum]
MVRLLRKFGVTQYGFPFSKSMALMYAGIPLWEHVAGVSVGLASQVDPLTGEINDYRIWTDIRDLGDHLGDMDFKIAGTRKGITAIQLDIKPAGIPSDMICQCLEPACEGRLQIIDHMEREISAPSTQDDRNPPRLGAQMLGSAEAPSMVTENQSIIDKVSRKRAFIIGVSYVFNDQFSELYGTINDANHIRNLLINDLSFPPSSIRLLTDNDLDSYQRPTRQNIIMGMRWLVEGAKSGDLLFFHFSGHGDLFEIFGSHLVDEEAIQSSLMNRIMVNPLPIGVKLFMTIDCCRAVTAMNLPFQYQMKRRGK